jgi:hypothetical protein
MKREYTKEEIDAILDKQMEELYAKWDKELQDNICNSWFTFKRVEKLLNKE